MPNNIIGIDPGTNTGVSVITIDDNFNVIDLKTYCLVLPLTTFELSRTYSKLKFLYDNVYSILNHYRPFSIGIEMPFQHRFANAVIQLSQYLATIETAILNTNPYVINYRYPPKMVKKLIGATGGGDKLAVFKAVSKIEEMKELFLSQPRTEHEADATAIAYITLEDLKKYPHKLIMNRDNFDSFRS